MKTAEKKMNKEAHRQRHIELHTRLDELVADFIFHTGKSLEDTSVMELIGWSYCQKIKPQEGRDEDN